MAEHVEIRDGKEYRVTVLPSDRRLAPGAVRDRATGDDSMRACPNCGRKRVAIKDAIKSGGRRWCPECRRRAKDQGKTKRRKKRKR